MNLLKYLLIISTLLISSGANAEFQLDPRFRQRYNVDGQERCEQMCFRCIDGGKDPDTCAAGIFFQICCSANGGKANGCGCRTAA